MLVIKPHAPVRTTDAPNLTKGAEVFKLATNLAVDHVLEVGVSEESYRRLYSVHSSAYVKQVLQGYELNGYGTTDAAANQHSVHSCEAMYHAVQAVLSGSDKVVFTPTSGFHHAGHNYGGGYCTFNGLVLAAVAMRSAKSLAQVLIVDGDGHFGDGTENIIISLGLGHWLHQCSLDKSSVHGDPDMARVKLQTALNSKKWDLVIYQAGADSHVQDPYHSGYLDDADWVARDNLVFTVCRNQGVPVIFNLAGGYNGKKTLDLHLSTVTTARRVFFGQQSPAHLSPLPDDESTQNPSYPQSGSQG